MSWRTDILTALRTRLLTVSGIDDWPVIYANRQAATEPAPDAQHLREMPFDINSNDGALGQAVRWRELSGTWQVMLCVPFDTDVFPALAFADSLELAFITSPLTITGGHVLRISTVMVGSPRPRDERDAWIRIPVVFTFTVLTHT
jgi:hypothetical protein